MYKIKCVNTDKFVTYWEIVEWLELDPDLRSSEVAEFETKDDVDKVYRAIISAPMRPDYEFRIKES
jgi:hypothetical protein